MEFLNFGTRRFTVADLAARSPFAGCLVSSFVYCYFHDFVNIVSCSAFSCVYVCLQ